MSGVSSETRLGNGAFEFVSGVGRSTLTLAGVAALVVALSPRAQAAPTDWPVTSVQASSELAGWPATSAGDGNAATIWSSNTHAVAESPESITAFLDAAHPVNYVKLTTRFDGTSALGFPVEFVVSTFDGANWTPARGFTHVARPTTSVVTLPLDDTFNAAAIRVDAKVLGDDKAGNYVFQLAEIGAGQDPDLEGVTYTATTVASSSALAGWPAAAAIDGNGGTVWSSNCDTPSSNEWIAAWWPNYQFQSVNLVKLFPRYSGTQALGFPQSFTVYYSNGAQWIQAAHYDHFPTPARGDWIDLALPSTVQANGLLIYADTLGADDVGNSVFQLAELQGGYDARLAQLTSSGNDGAGGRIELENVGSEAFDRVDQLGNWNFDERGILIQPNPGANQNIYAPSIVQNGGTWNVYFGGWDGSATPNDRVSMTTSVDDFMSFGAHALMIDDGPFVHVNNDCVVKVGPNDWRMAYTTYGGPDGTLNRPGYATSTDGGTWTPNVGTTAALMNMSGYAGWANADVNGSNVICQDPSGTWHLYFVNFNDFPGVHHATSTDFVNYSYVGKASQAAVMTNDLKPFDSGGQRYYVGAYHMNGQTIYTSVSTDINAATPQPAFTNVGADDNYMVAVGLVQDGSRIYGALYGATASSSLTGNRIYGRWLQKKVIFENSSVRWGDIERGYGPDRIHLYLASGDDVETGRFAVYDTDGVTLLYHSPVVTICAGDHWSYSGAH